MEIILVAADAGLVIRKSWETHALYSYQVDQCRAEKRQWSTLEGREADSPTGQGTACLVLVISTADDGSDQSQDLCAQCYKNSRGERGGARAFREEQPRGRQRGGLQHKPHW